MRGQGMMLYLLDSIVSWVLRAVVAFHRLVIHPLLPLGGCRFTPSCSQYMLDSISKNGGLRGACLGLCRIARCMPGNPGGHDPA